MRLLVVTAVAAERDAIAAAAPPGAARILCGGVGPAAAAAATATALAREQFDLVVCAGIGGGFGPLQIGHVAVASQIVFADLGADTAAGFVPVSGLGFGQERYPVPARLAVDLADRTGAHLGTVLTVATVTGTAARAEQLVDRYPDAVAEAMEGAGVAAAAHLHEVAAAEVRAISNRAGPRERDAWDVPAALTALGRAVAAICAAPG